MRQLSPSSTQDVCFCVSWYCKLDLKCKKQLENFTDGLNYNLMNLIMLNFVPALKIEVSGEDITLSFILKTPVSFYSFIFILHVYRHSSVYTGHYLLNLLLT